MNKEAVEIVAADIEKLIDKLKSKKIKASWNGYVD